jgi:hypothetical protein
MAARGLVNGRGPRKAWEGFSFQQIFYLYINAAAYCRYSCTLPLMSIREISHNLVL